MAEFTKGDWKARHPINNDITIYTGEYGKSITQVAMIFESSLNAEANAHLIASSPKMADLLQRLVTNGWSAGISEEATEILQTLT